MKDGFWTTNEIAKESGVTPQHVNRVAREYSFGVMKGRSYLYTQEEVKNIQDYFYKRRRMVRQLLRDYIREHGPVTEGHLIRHIDCNNVHLIMDSLADISFEDGDLAENEKGGIYYLDK